MENNKKKFIRNPKGLNQWNLRSLKEIQKIYKVRNCSDNTFASRTRPCIEHQMKRCSAPCVNKIKKVDYFEDISGAQSFLSSSAFLPDLLGDNDSKVFINA